MSEKKIPLQPRHLGDGVYIHDEGYRICLAVNHHENKVIWMERNEIEGLIAFAKKAEIIEQSLNRQELNNLPIHIHEGVSNIHVEIIDWVVHVKPNSAIK